MKPSRRALLAGFISSVSALGMPAQARPLHGFFTPIIGNALQTLSAAATFSTLYSGQGTLPAMPGAQSAGYDVAGQIENHVVTAKLDCWDFVIIEAGQQWEVTNVCGNGDKGAVQIAKTVYYFGANGSFNQVTVTAPSIGANPSGMTTSLSSGAVGHRVMLQGSTQTADTYADLICDTYPVNGTPWRQVRRFLLLGTANSGANRRRAYTDNVVGNDATAVIGNSAKPFKSIVAARLAAASDAPGTLVWVNETSGANPTTLTSPTRGTMNFPTVYYEDNSLVNASSGGVSNIVPVEVKPQNGGRIVITRSGCGASDYYLFGSSHPEFFWPCSRNVDYNFTWLMSNNTESVITGFNVYDGLAPNRFADRIIMSINPIRIDITADADNYYDIDGLYVDELFSGGAEMPNPTYLGDWNGVSSCMHSNDANLVCNSTYQVGNDIFSTTSANMGEVLYSGVVADQNRWLYLNHHVSKTCPIASVLRDPYNETTIFYLAGAPFTGAAQVSISGNVATVSCFTDTTYTKPKVHRFNRVGYGPTSVYNVAFVSGPLANKAPSGLLGFPVITTTPTTFTLDVTGLGLANAAATNSGVFTYNSSENNIAHIYDEVIGWKTNAGVPSNVQAFNDADPHQTILYHPAFSPGGAFPSAGIMPYVTSSTGIGANNSYVSPITSPLVSRTPRIVSSGSTLTGKGFKNGGLNSSGAVAANPSVATQDGANLTTTITTATANGRTLVICSGALPTSALFYWGCTVAVGSQKLKVAQNINNSTNSTTLSDGTVMPANSFYAAPIGTFSDVTTATTWSFSDNQHCCFKGDRIFANATYDGNGNINGWSSVANVVSVSGETVTLDSAPLGTITTPTTFARGPGYFANSQQPYVCGIELYHDAYGVLINPSSYGTGAGDLIYFGFRQHPDAFQIQSISYSNGNNTDLTKPNINGLIMDRTIFKGKDLQSQIIGGGSVPVGVGTVSFDSNGYPTFAAPTLTLTAIDTGTPQPYQVAFGNSSYLPDFVNTPAGATQYTYVNLYKLTFSGASGNFPYHINGWGNIRLFFSSGALAGKSMKLYSHITSGTTMVAYVIDDMNICNGSFTGAVNDTAVHPLNFTDGSVVTVGTFGYGAGVAATEAQSMIMTLNQANPLKPTVHAPLTKFASQSGLSYQITPCVFRGLRRAYMYTQYDAVAAPNAYNVILAPYVRPDFALANFNAVQSTLYSTQSSAATAQWAWQGIIGSNFIDCYKGYMGIFGNGDRGFYDTDFYNCVGLFDAITGSTNYTPNAITSANMKNNIGPYIINIDRATGKVSSIYLLNGGIQPISTIPRLSALRYPFDALGNAVTLASPIGAVPTS